MKDISFQGNTALGRLDQSIENAVICFTAGTAIKTVAGEKRIETLRPGDLVLTMDNGPQPVRWIGQKSLNAASLYAPIRFAKGAMGNDRDLLVSPHHRMLCTGPRALEVYGAHEVLVDARSMVDDFGVTVAYGGTVTYVHILFDQHQILFANGTPSESFDPARYALRDLTSENRNEIFDIFPNLKADPSTYGPTSRICVNAVA